MKRTFLGWADVARRLVEASQNDSDWLDIGQRCSLVAASKRIVRNGLIIADEVGMGKTRIAVEVCRAVQAAGGRVAILVPTGLGYQWQDEFTKARMGAPQIVRSLWSYLEAWKDEGDMKPWYAENSVILTHTFANWRLSESSGNWRWGLLPAMYAYWCKKQGERYPRGFSSCGINDSWVHNAAKDIADNVFAGAGISAQKALSSIARDYHWHTNPSGGDYVKNGKYRQLLHLSVGVGLGEFDLVVIDEAHKARGGDSGLSRLLNEVVLQPVSGRRLALTATPVELDVEQWMHTLDRVGVTALGDCRSAIAEYADAVKKVRTSWAGSKLARTTYIEASKKYQSALSPYLIRRDKRMDQAVKRFVDKTGEPYDAYREEREIRISPMTLTTSWKQAVCAAESLSWVSRKQDDSVAKRLRLTMGSGHGISTLMDSASRTDADLKQEAHDELEKDEDSAFIASGVPGSKRLDRVVWWKGVLARAMSDTEALYNHPAILATVHEIEKYTNSDQKVLVFGRYTAPLRALTELLNAREILRCVRNDNSLPQERMHESERRAMPSALEQMGMSHSFAEIDDFLAGKYRRMERQRETLRTSLLDYLKEAFGSATFEHKLVLEIERRMTHNRDGYLRLVRAVGELVDDTGDITQESCSDAFLALIKALRDRGDEDQDNEGDENGSGSVAERLWPVLEQRLEHEYSQQSGTFSRLLYGDTRHETRRFLQMGFNRPGSFPRVLVAQSLVGREGLNLHEACRVVVLLHPEWNPGVVEQQIGRVDRVNSRWSKELDAYCGGDGNCQTVPRIEIRPVVFEGTYDEYNWNVLRERWDDLRAQLHGVVVPQRFRAALSGEEAAIISELDAAGPDFSPVREK